MLDTPLHIAQLKTLEKQEFAMEFTRFDRDACLCDRCFRFLDRRAASKNMNGAKSVTEVIQDSLELNSLINISYFLCLRAEKT